MAFELPSMPNFNVQPPQMPSALDQYGKMLQLKSLMGNQQLQQQELQQRQQMQPGRMEEQQQDIQTKTLENQKTQMFLDSQQSMMKAVSSGFLTKYVSKDGGNGSDSVFDSNGAFSELVKPVSQGGYGVLPDQASGLVDSLLKRTQSMAEINKTNAQAGEALAAVRSKTFDVLGNKFNSITEIAKTDPAKGTAALAAFQQDLATNPKAYQGLSQQEMAELHGATTLDHLPAVAALMGFEGSVADAHKKQAEALKAQQSVIPAGGGLSPETQQSVQKDVAVATNPQIQAGKEAVAAAEGQARANIELAMARGSNAALANVPQHLIPPATEAATKAGTEYAQAKSVSDRLAAMMEAAKKGNVVSYQLLPEEGALQVVTNQGIHRINMAEIQNYGGGSAWQKLQGHIGKALTGESIPASVLSDMGDIQKIMSEGSRTKYENTLKTINQNFGAQFKPIEMDGLSDQKKKTSTKPGAFSWDDMPQHQ